MTQYDPPSDLWLAQRLSSLTTDIATLKNQVTRYTTDNEGNAKVIIGNLATGPTGEATGINAWGIAVYHGGKWIQVTGEEGGGGGGAPTGPAGGDLASEYPNPTVGTGVITESKLAAALLGPAANVFGLRKIGSGSLEAMAGNATPGGPPTGTAGGSLTGTYPNPTIGAGIVTNAMIKAAAGIEDSKLALTTVVKLAGTQSITGQKNWETTTGKAITLYKNTLSINSEVNAIELPFKLTFTSGSAILRAFTAGGAVLFEKNPNGGFTQQLFRNVMKVVAGPEVTTMQPTVSLRATPNFESEAETVSGWHAIAVDSLPVFVVGGEGHTAEATLGRHGLNTAGGFTFTVNRGILMEDASGGGTVTTQRALDVLDLKKGETNYSVYSVGAEVKLHNAGPVEMGVGFGAWGHAVPAAQHAALPAPKTLLEVEAWAKEVDEVLKEYGMTK